MTSVIDGRIGDPATQTPTAKTGSTATTATHAALTPRPVRRADLGVNVTLSSDPTKVEADYALAASLGFKWVRTSQEMQWGDGTGMYALAALRTHVNAAIRHGLRLIQCCQGMPRTMARGGIAGHYGPKDAASATRWGDWVGECCAIVEAADGIVSITNEPDNFGWDTTPSASDVAMLHVAAIEGRNRRAPNAILSTAEMAPGSNPEPLAFLTAIAKSALHLFDAQRLVVGWHNYLDPRYPADYDAVWNMNHRMRDVHAALVYIGHPKMKIMGGEWGVANGPPGNVRSLSPQGVADYVRDQYIPSFERMIADGVPLGPLLWYTLRDGPQPSTEQANYCGIVDAYGNEKPVAAVFREYLA